MKDLLKEKNIELLIIQSKDKFSSIPDDDPRIKAYKKIFTILKEALQFSGLPLEGINLKYNGNNFIIFESDGNYYGVLTPKEIPSDEILAVVKEILKPSEERPSPEPEKVAVKEKPKPEVKKPTPPPEEEIKVSPEVFEKIKEIAGEYLGAFAGTIFENQLKDTRIKPEDTTLRKTKRFVLNLQNAASMIIGPSQAKEMASKMLKLLP